MEQPKARSDRIKTGGPGSCKICANPTDLSVIRHQQSDSWCRGQSRAPPGAVILSAMSTVPWLCTLADPRHSWPHSCGAMRAMSLAVLGARTGTALVQHKRETRHMSSSRYQVAKQWMFLFVLFYLLTKGIALLQTWCFSLPGSSSALRQLRLLLRHRVQPQSWGAKAEGSIRKQGDVSRKLRLQLHAAQQRFTVPAGGKAGTGAPPKCGGGMAASARYSAESGQQEETCSSKLVCSDGT